MDEDIIAFEKGKDEINKLKAEKAVLLVNKIIETDYSKIVEKIKRVKIIYKLATREEKAMLWHLLIERMTSYHDRIVVRWKYGKTYTIQKKKLSGLLNRDSSVQRQNPLPSAIQGNVEDLLIKLEQFSLLKSFVFR